MGKKKSYCGSITVFSALSLMLVVSFLFALLEAGRIYGLSVVSDRKTQIAIESVFAQYQPKLFDAYHILGLDGAFAGEEFSRDRFENMLDTYLWKNLQEKSSADFFRMKPTGIEMQEYQLLTDGKGKVFEEAVSTYMKSKMAADTVNKLLLQYESISDVAADTQVNDGVEKANAAILEAKSAMEEEAGDQSDKSKAESADMEAKTISMSGNAAAKEQETARVGSAAAKEGQNQESVKEESAENPLEVVMKIKQEMALSIFVGSEAGLSAKKVDLSDAVSMRKLQQGTSEDTPHTSLSDKCRMAEYIDETFCDYTSPAEKRKLSYELEYILCGHNSDKANLESTLNRLLLIRQSANFLYLLKDPVKWKETLAAATSLAGFSGNPVVIRVVQIGVAAAWAFVESILDIRALLSGDKISLMKGAAEWTLDTKNILSSVTSGAKAKNCKNGLTYQQYLKGLFLLESVKKLAYRSMDLMEIKIRESGYSYCRMDCMIRSSVCRVFWKAESLFGRMTVIGKKKYKTEGYEISRTKEFTYA